MSGVAWIVWEVDLAMVLGLAAVLAVVGLGISVYMTLAYYRRFRQGHGVACPVRGACASVLETEQARVFGVPNSLLGILFYAGTLGCLAGRQATGRTEWIAAAFAGAVLATGFGVALAYALLFRLRLSCPLCWTSHAINALLVVLFGMLLRAGV